MRAWSLKELQNIQVVHVQGHMSGLTSLWCGNAAEPVNEYDFDNYSPEKGLYLFQKSPDKIIVGLMGYDRILDYLVLRAAMIETLLPFVSRLHLYDKAITEFDPKKENRSKTQNAVDTTMALNIAGHIVAKEDLKEEIITLENLKESLSRGNLYVVLGLSGSGKSTLVNHLVSYVPRLEVATKIMTRAPRIGSDTNTVFVDKERFVRLYEEGAILAPVECRHNFYGVYKPQIDMALRCGKDIIVDHGIVDVVLDIKKEYPVETRVISLKSSEERLAEQLLRRYSRMLLRTPEEYSQKMWERDGRLDEIARRTYEYESMLEIADFVSCDEFFPARQKEVRNYVLRCRGLGGRIILHERT